MYLYLVNPYGAREKEKLHRFSGMYKVELGQEFPHIRAAKKGRVSAKSGR